jgi:hypothetical protein
MYTHVNTASRGGDSPPLSTPSAIKLKPLPAPRASASLPQNQNTSISIGSRGIESQYSDSGITSVDGQIGGFFGDESAVTIREHGVDEGRDSADDYREDSLPGAVSVSKARL